MPTQPTYAVVRSTRLILTVFRLHSLGKLGTTLAGDVSWHSCAIRIMFRLFFF